MAKVRVNKDACVGCGLCTSIAAEALQIGDDGLAEAIAEEVEDVAAVEEAAAACPVQAIEVE